VFIRLCIWFYVCVYVLSLDRPGLQVHLKGEGACVYAFVYLVLRVCLCALP
jgi:hypothetical protein